MFYYRYLIFSCEKIKMLALFPSYVYEYSNDKNKSLTSSLYYPSIDSTTYVHAIQIIYACINIYISKFR